MRGAQARGEEAQSPAGALEVRDCRPALPHKVGQRRVEGVRRPDTLAQGQSLLFSLLPLPVAMRVGAPHLRKYLAVGIRRRCGGTRIGRAGEQPTLYDVQDLVALDRLPALVLACGKMLDDL